MKKSIVLMALVASFGAYGCSADCESMCEDAKECPGNNDTDDCAAICEKTEKMNEALNCSEKYEAMLDCSADQDICNESASSACKSEGEAYGVCVVNGCMSNPSACE